MRARHCPCSKKWSTATRFCSSEYRLHLLCGGMSPPFSRYSSYQAYKVAQAGYPSSLMTDAGLMSYLTNSSAALTFSSLEYIRVSKSHRTGTGFRQRPRLMRCHQPAPIGREQITRSASSNNRTPRGLARWDLPARRRKARRSKTPERLVDTARRSGVSGVFKVKQLRQDHENSDYRTHQQEAGNNDNRRKMDNRRILDSVPRSGQGEKAGAI